MTTGRKLSDLDVLADLQDGDKLYVVRDPAMGDPESHSILAEDARDYFFTNGLVGMIVRDVQITAQGNIRIIGNAANGDAVDVTLGVPGALTPLREIHYVTQTTYNAADSQLEGALSYGDVSDITVGNLLVFVTPDALPDSTNRMELRITGDSANRVVFSYSGTSLEVSQLIPQRVYWGVITMNGGIVLLSSAGDLDPVKQIRRTITNAELKMLDTAYLEIIPAPGANKFISVALVAITKLGDDIPPVTNDPWYGIAISTDNVLTEAEVAAGNSATFGFVFVPTWPVGEQRVVFIGVPDDRRDVTGINVPTTEEPADFFTRVFERVPGTVNNADGTPIKWWRTKIAYDQPSDVFSGNTYASGWANDADIALVEDIARYAYAGLIQAIDPTLTLPLYSPGNEYVWIDGNLAHTLLSADANQRFLESVGGHALSENSALVYGIIINQNRSRLSAYSSDAFDGFIESIDDVSFNLSINYQILEI